MNPPQAKLILSACRPDGRDLDLPDVAEAVREAERDPALKAWWEHERQFDAAVVRRLGGIAPPAGLREAILAGARTGRPRRLGWENSVWLAIAASVAVLVSAVLSRATATGPATADLVTFALHDLAEAHDNHVARPADLMSVQERLAAESRPLPGSLKVDLAELRSKRCRAVRIAGHEVFEICFQRDGVWFHLYAARQTGGKAAGPQPVATRGEFAGTAWSDAGVVYALVTRAGPAALQRVL